MRLISYNTMHQERSTRRPRWWWSLDTKTNFWPWKPARPLTPDSFPNHGSECVAPPNRHYAQMKRKMPSADIELRRQPPSRLLVPISQASSDGELGVSSLGRVDPFASDLPCW